jgi:uncharacterized protein YfaT (DUF1175 family)
MRSAALLLFLATPHLTDPADVSAFRRWFTFLAEAQYFRDPSELPAEITDCAALIRYSYRETLRRHDDSWRNSLHLRMVPSLPPVRELEYPRPPLGVNLFQTGPDTAGQFADAKTLRHWNTHLVGRDLTRALPGDLLFYRQLRQLSELTPFHSMVWLGPSQIDHSPGPWLLYHTGPEGSSPGQVKRVKVTEMLLHPEPRWRPVPGNSNFLGVYRWNIL